MAALAVGGLWLLTGFLGTDGLRRDLARTRADPRAASAAIWVQRGLGLLLVGLGLLGLLRRG